MKSPPFPFDSNTSFDEAQDFVVMGLVSQICSLDYALREFRKMNDKSSQKRYEEIHKGFGEIVDISTMLYRSHVSHEMIFKQITEHFNKSKPKKKIKTKKPDI